ncbi:MAG: trigger factor [Verrucomicrobiota bacterium]|jgi:trigger factor
MNIVVEKHPKCVATLRVEIPADTVQDQRQLISRKFLIKARIPGFRPGKAPLAIIEKRFIKEITEELHENLVNNAYDAALKQENLRVINFGPPTDLTTLSDGRLTFSSTLTLGPDVQLPEYMGVTVTVPPLALPDQELQLQLTGLLEHYAEFKIIEGRPAAMADFAVIDYTSTVDGMPTDEFLGKPTGYLSGRNDFWIRLDDQTFLPGFAAQVVGMNPGDSRQITITLPTDFPVPNLQSRELVFTTTLKELQESILPELNDELASRIVPGKSLAELTEIIRDNMQLERKRHIENLKINQIVAHFNSLVDFELPEALVSQETQTQADTMVRRGVQSGMSELEIQSQQAEIFSNAGQQAISSLRTNFILHEIATVENITVSENELINHLAQIAHSRKEAPKKFIKEMHRAGRLPSVSHSLVIGKAIDFVVKHANVVESTETPHTED